MYSRRREEQIASIKRLIPLAREHVKGQFEVGLQLMIPAESAIIRQIGTTRVIITFRMTLPPTFPNDTPRAQLVLPPSLRGKNVIVKHSLCDDRGNVVLCPQLNSWSSSYDIGRIMNDLVKQFSSRPPQLISGSGAPNHRNHGVSGAGASKTKGFYFDNVPKVPDMVPLLRKMDLKELQRIDAKSADYKDFLRGVKEIKELREKLLNLKQQTITLATGNLGYEPQVKKLTDEVNAVIPSVTASEDELERLHTQLAVEARKFTKEKILDEMLSRADKLDAESEDIRSRYMDEDLDFFKISNPKGLFLKYKKVYVEKRKQYHAMKAKIERFRLQYGLKDSAYMY